MTITSVELVEHRPTVDEYRRLISAVGWKPRDTEAISRGLASSQFAVCAETGSEVVGMGRVIGDGGLHYYVTDVVVVPAFQRRGLGSRIVAALTKHVEGVPYKNTWVGLFAVEGTADFYARFGYKAQRPNGPAMFRWLNRTDGSRQ